MGNGTVTPLHHVGHQQTRREGYPRVYQWQRKEHDHKPDNNDNSSLVGQITSLVDTNDDDDSPSQQQQQLLLLQAAQATWNWCKYFVVPHNLCPWAAASVQAKGAVSIYLVNETMPTTTTTTTTNDGSMTTLRHALVDVAAEFCTWLKEHLQQDANTAIALVVFVSDDVYRDFDVFYNHFEELWDEFLEDEQYDTIMWAAFHPNWKYGGGALEEDPLNLEKASPYPTISIVSQTVLDQAGPQATERIATTNQATLAQFDWTTWRDIYQEAINGGK